MTNVTVVHLPLAEVADVIRGVTFQKYEVSEHPSSDRTPVIRAGNIGNELELERDLIWLPSSRVSETQIMRPGDIAMCASSGSTKIVGKSALLRKMWRGTVGAFCVIIRSKETHCDHRFIAYFLRSAKFREWAQNAAGASIKNIRKSDLEKFLVPFPPLDEQRRIVGILNRAAKIERLRARAADRLREFIPALFVKMFGDPAENPMGWECYPFSTVVKDKTRMVQKIKRRDYRTSGATPIVDQGKDLIAGYTDLNLGQYNGPFPAIIFGDHTRRFKLIRFPFFLGADGAKLLVPVGKYFDPVFVRTNAMLEYRECWVQQAL